MATKTSRVHLSRSPGWAGCAASTGRSWSSMSSSLSPSRKKELLLGLTRGGCVPVSFPPIPKTPWNPSGDRLTPTRRVTSHQRHTSSSSTPAERRNARSFLRSVHREDGSSRPTTTKKTASSCSSRKWEEIRWVNLPSERLRVPRESRTTALLVAAVRRVGGIGPSPRRRDRIGEGRSRPRHPRRCPAPLRGAIGEALAPVRGRRRQQPWPTCYGPSCLLAGCLAGGGGESCTIVRVRCSYRYDWRENRGLGACMGADVVRALLTELLAGGWMGDSCLATCFVSQ